MQERAGACKLLRTGVNILPICAYNHRGNVFYLWSAGESFCERSLLGERSLALRTSLFGNIFLKKGSSHPYCLMADGEKFCKVSHMYLGRISTPGSEV